MGEESVESLRDVGELLAYLRQPDPPKGFRDLVDKAPLLKKILTMGPNVVKNAPCQQVVSSGEEVDLNRLPIQTCWPGDVAPLVTWPLVITRGPEKRAHESRHLPHAIAGVETNSLCAGSPIVAALWILETGS